MSVFLDKFSWMTSKRRRKSLGKSNIVAYWMLYMHQVVMNDEIKHQKTFSTQPYQLSSDWHVSLRDGGID